MGNISEFNDLRPKRNETMWLVFQWDVITQTKYLDLAIYDLRKDAELFLKKYRHANLTKFGFYRNKNDKNTVYVIKKIVKNSPLGFCI